ncbi:hypothetical protein Dimus_031512 [Dionaea muscipula]
MKPSLSSLQLEGIVMGSPYPHFLELELSASSFLSAGGGGSIQSHNSGDDDFGSHVGSEEAERRTPLLPDYTRVPTLNKTGVALGFSSVEAFVHESKGRKGVGGRGHHESLDRTRADPHGLDDRERRDHRDVEGRHLDPPPAGPMKGKEVASDYPRESQRRCQVPQADPIGFQDPICGRELVVPIVGSARRCSSSVTPTTYAKERFKHEMIGGRREELDSNGHLLC